MWHLNYWQISNTTLPSCNMMSPALTCRNLNSFAVGSLGCQHVMDEITTTYLAFAMCKTLC